MPRYFIASTLVLLAVIGCGGPPPQAGGPGGGPEGPPPSPPPAMDSAQRLEQTMKDLTERLKLSPEQAVRVKAVIKAGEDQKEAMRPDGDRYDSIKEMEKFFQRLRQVDKDTEQALSKVLSQSQLKEYKEYLEERRSRLVGGRGQGDGPPAGGRPPGGGRTGGGR